MQWANSTVLAHYKPICLLSVHSSHEFGTLSVTRAASYPSHTPPAALTPILQTFPSYVLPVCITQRLHCKSQCSPLLYSALCHCSPQPSAAFLFLHSHCVWSPVTIQKNKQQSRNYAENRELSRSWSLTWLSISPWSIWRGRQIQVKVNTASGGLKEEELQVTPRELCHPHRPQH